MSTGPQGRFGGCMPLCVLMLTALATMAPAQANAAETKTPTAAERMSAFGHETKLLEQQVGTWDVTCTLRLTADAEPVVVKGLVAERRMVGRYMEEVMKPAPGSKVPDFRRIAYLTYSKVEGRWQYVSLDTRFPVGIMPAHSFDKGSDKELVLEFAPLGFVGLGSEVEGRMMRSNFVITRDGKDHEVARQYWVTSDGTGRKWLAVEYDYTRRD